MKSFLKMFLAVIIAQILLIAVVLGFIVNKLDEKVTVEKGSVLVQVLDGEIPEAPAEGGLPIPGVGAGPSHTAILENLEKARYDERIKAVVLKIGNPAIGFAKMEELRERIAQLRDAGKPIWAYTEYLGRGPLYLGASCDSFFFLPTGYVSLRGVAAGRPFIKGTLDKLGIQENLHRIGAYKSAAEMIQREDLSPTSRANVEWILDEVYPHMNETIERERDLDPGTLENRVFAAGAMTVAQARELNLVDRLAYWDELEQSLLALPGVEEDDDADEAFGSRPRLIWGDDYAEIERKDAGIDGKKTIAVVHATGLIQGEASGYSFPFGATMGAATMTKAFRDAAQNKDVAAIIYRVDSGGGESSTSWKIQRAAWQAARAKPLVVSMVDVAGSGGYLICYPFEPLIANPHSIVGSIGSISGKFNMRDLYQKLGITWDFVTRGPNAMMESEVTNYTPEQWEAFKATHWRDYYEWVEDIAREREMTVAEVDSVGRGRVFTGSQALALKLIDQTGSFDDAVRAAKEKAGIPEGQAVKFVHYPAKKGLLEALRSGGLGAAMHALVSEFLRPWREPTGRTWAVDWTEYR